MDRAPSIAFEGITKRFGGVVANDGVGCSVAAGTLHAFLGENGAGKSTLMKMLGGSFKPDSGRILLDGSPVVFRSPDEARRSGIGVVQQHFTLIPAMSVLDNVILGDPRVPFFLPRRSLCNKVEAAAKKFGFAFDLSSPVWKLSISERQKLELFKLLWRDARVLVLDEPTSQLAPFEAEEILTAVSKLASEGRTVLLVSHNIGEVLRFSSRVSVLRKGRCIETMDSCDASMDRLARMMIGELVTVNNGKPEPASVANLFVLRGVFLASGKDRPQLRDVTLEIRSGEVLGLAGVAGSGRDELAAVLAGKLLPSRGVLEYRDRPVHWRTLQKPGARAAHVPADPVREGVALTLSVLDNLFLGDTTNGKYRFGPFLRRASMRDEARQRLDQFRVHPSDPDAPCAALSGGNLQRLVLARETALSSSLLVAVNPTAGLDIAAAKRVKEELRAYAAKGRAVVLISYDLQDLLDACDRVAVLFDGEVVGVESTENIDSNWAGLLMGGTSADTVRLLLRPNLSIDESAAEPQRAAVLRLLENPNGWQRRLGAQIGLRVLDDRNVAAVASLERSERNDDARAWLVLLLAKLDAGAYLDHLVASFDANPGPFLAAQRSLVAATDREGFRTELLRRIADGAAPWERTLAKLTLRHIDGHEGRRGSPGTPGEERSGGRQPHSADGRRGRADA